MDMADESAMQSPSSSEASPETRVFRSNQLMSVAISDQALVSIEYPAVVHNVDKALQTMGGTETIAETLKEQGKKLVLQFRPSDIYCKPCFGTPSKVAGFVLKVRRRKKLAPGLDSATSPPVGQEDPSLPSTSGETTLQGETGGGGGEKDDGYEYQLEVMGQVHTDIKFDAMCDFQYLPVVRQEGGTYRGIAEQLSVSRLESLDQYLSRDVPLFIPPATFSRLDTPQDYGFLLPYTNGEEAPDSLTARRNRQNFSIKITFDEPTPMDPVQEAVELACKANALLRNKVKEMFEEKPVWSKIQLLYQLQSKWGGYSWNLLKFILPSIAYMFLNGPWRTFWVRIGYDPRTQPEAKRYQLIDFRHDKGTPHSEVKVKRSTFRSLPKVPQISNRHEIDLDFSKEDETHQEVKPVDFEFRVDELPRWRQVHYMLCDIHEPRVQELAASNDNNKTECTERNGWCVDNFTDMTRTIISKHVDKLNPAVGVWGRKRHAVIKKKNKELEKTLIDLSTTQETDTCSLTQHTD